MNTYFERKITQLERALFVVAAILVIEGIIWGMG